MAIEDLKELASEIAEYERRFREAEAKRVGLECEVAARGYEVEAMYNTLLEQEKVHVETINLLQQIVDHIPMPVFWKDLDGVCKGCNYACEVTLEKQKHEIVGKTVFDLFKSEYADVYSDADMKTLRDGKYTYSAEFEKRDGTRVMALFHMRTYRDTAGDIKGIIVFAHTPCDGRLCP